MKEFTNVCILVGCETKANTHVLDVEVSDLSRWLFGFEFLEVRRHPCRSHYCQRVRSSWRNRSVEIPESFPCIAEVA